MKTNLFFSMAVMAAVALGSLQTAKAQSWNVGGNAVTQDAAVGTTTAYGLKVITNNTPRIYVAPAGSVGIGTTTPGSTLDVLGGSWDVGSNEGDFRIGNPSYRLKIGVATAGGGAGDVRMRAAGGTGRLMLGSNSLDVLTINGAGYVGIGITSPQALLDVYGDAHINGVTIGKGGNNNFTNSALGGSALYSNTSGIFNTAVGYGSLYYNTTGNNNMATGYFTMYSNTSGSGNTANGVEALYHNTTGNYNTATGVNSLLSNTTGYYNTANGAASLQSNSTGIENTANGYAALYLTTNGNYNTANGYAALYNNGSGSNNIATGTNAMYYNTSGSYNTTAGNYSLYSNTTGYYNTANGYAALHYNSTGSYNTATGTNALYSNTTGSSNMASGEAALYSSTTGSGNTAAGTVALQYNTTGTGNTATGEYALWNNTTGNYNTGVGYDALVSYSSYSNSTALGVDANVDASNKVRVGNTSVTSIGGQVGWTSFSDGRYKKNIKEDVQGLAFINALRPVTYTLDLKGINDHYDALLKNGPDSAKQKLRAGMKESETAGSKIVYNGFIAQEVEAAANKLNYSFSGVDKPATKDGLYGLRYSDFVVPLVKAMQELSKTNDSLKTQNEQLRARLDKIEAMLSQNSNAAATSNALVSKQTISLTSAAALSQNTPNPFSNSTTISYSLPAGSSNAVISFYDANGRILKSEKLAGNGNGTITLQASELPSGVYRYALVVDGRMIDSKQMMIAR